MFLAISGTSFTHTERSARFRKRTRANAVLSDSDASEGVSPNNGATANHGSKRTKRRDIKPGFFRIQDSDEESDIEPPIVRSTPLPSGSTKDVTCLITTSSHKPKKAPQLTIKVDPPLWLSSSVPETSHYVPQIGDLVVYFNEGHIEYLNDLLSRNYDLESQLGSVGEVALYPKTFLGRVLSLHYFPGVEVTCKITLAMSRTVQEDLASLDFNETMEIVICDSSGCPDFLVLANQYFSSLPVMLRSDECCIGRFCDADHEIVIKDIASLAAWNKYAVSFKEGGDEGAVETGIFRMSPWEIRKSAGEWPALPTIPSKGST